MRHRWLPPSVATAAAFGVFLWVLHYPWSLALLASTAIGALLYSAQGTWERLRDLYARPGEAVPFLATPESRPREIEQDR